MKDITSLFSDKKFNRAAIVYSACSLTDALSTYCGLFVGTSLGRVEEISFVHNSYISLFDGPSGIFLNKLALGSLIITGLGVANYFQKEKHEKKYNIPGILEFGGALTAGIGLSWIPNAYLF